MIEIELAAWLSAAYAVALLLVAHGIDLLARRAHTAHEDQETQGFVYHEDHDAWMCPEDQWLWPQSFDPGNRVMRYRGSPVVCNSCPVKESCTSSDDGREMKRMVDPWPSSESARFHRGIACSVLVLAVLWPIVAVFTVQSIASQIMLLVIALAISVAGVPLWSHLRHSPVDPDGVLFRSLDENLEDRALTLETLDRRRTSYASDRRRPVFVPLRSSERGPSDTLEREETDGDD